ncbi:MAG: metallophosphoesterase family protein [Candidatus Brocadiia bacterium]
MARGPGRLLLAVAVGWGAACAAGEKGPVRFVVYGGTEGSGPHHRAVAAQVAKLRPELVLHCGGLVADPARPEAWQAFEAFTAPVFESAPFYACRGREDVSVFAKGKVRPEGVSWGGTTYYSFDHRGLHFVALDSALRVTAKDPQTEWLRKDLEAAEGKRIFVLLCRPIYTVAGKPHHRRAEMFWSPLFARHGVTAVFSGEHHIYYRTEAKGVTYVVTGGGGAPLDEVRDRRGLLDGDVAGAFYHCIEVVAGEERVRARVVDSEGRTRDEFFIPPSSRGAGP